jgi:hypothetical protein
VNLTVVMLGSAFLILLTGIIWVMARIYNTRLSRIDEELQAITVMLKEMPKETSLKEYMFAHEQRLHAIGERLGAHPDTDLLQKYMQDQTTQMLAIISTLEDGGKTGATKADLEITLRVINELLERVLWSLRFDEDKYSESAETNSDSSGVRGKKNINRIERQLASGCESQDGNSMQSILNESDNSYGAILKYMQQTGKSGSEALHALETAAGSRSR